MVYTSVLLKGLHIQNVLLKKKSKQNRKILQQFFLCQGFMSRNKLKVN